MSEGKPIRIVLAEDRPPDAVLVREMLKDTGLPHTLKVCVRLTDALAAIAEEPPDLVLLDLCLPDASGLEGLREVARLHPELPAVVLTTLDETHGREAVRLGAQDYIPKDKLCPSALARIVGHAMDRQAWIHERAGLLAERALLRAEREVLRRDLETHLSGFDQDIVHHLEGLRNVANRLAQEPKP